MFVCYSKVKALSNVSDTVGFFQDLNLMPVKIIWQEYNWEIYSFFLQ